MIQPSYGFIRDCVGSEVIDLILRLMDTELLCPIFA